MRDDDEDDEEEEDYDNDDRSPPPPPRHRRRRRKGWWRLARQPKEEVFVTAHVTCNGEALHGIPVATGAAPVYDAEPGCLRWGEEELLPFPGVKYRDLSIDARLVLCVWGGAARSEAERDVPLAVAALDLFTDLGVLRVGKQKLRLHWTTMGAGAGLAAEPGAAEGVEAGEDFGLRLEKAREAYVFNRMAPVDWLDRVTLPYTGRILAAELAAATRRRARRGRRKGGVRGQRRRGGKDQQDGGDAATDGDEQEEGEDEEEEEEEKADCGYLVVNLPMFQHPVLYEEKACPTVGGIPPLGGGAAAALSSLTAAAAAGTGGTPASSPRSALMGPGLGGFGEDEQGGATSLKMLNNLPGWELSLIHDCEAEASNPVESKYVLASRMLWIINSAPTNQSHTSTPPTHTPHRYRKLAHDKIRGALNPNLKPNKEERERIEALLGSPSDQLRMEEKDLLWAFRHSLTDNRKALTKFLLSVDWSVEQEAQQVPALLEQWRSKAGVDISDALKLLGRCVPCLRLLGSYRCWTYHDRFPPPSTPTPRHREKAFQHEMVRAFAVDALGRASDEELVTYLLQLVQALRYEAAGGGAPGGEPPLDMTMSDSGRAAGGGPGAEAVGALARFLIERACQSLELANFLYWYLRVELEDAGAGAVFQAAFDAFGRALRERRPDLLDLLCKQDAFFGRVAGAQRRARDEKGRKDGKEEKLRLLLAETAALPPGTPSVPMPLDPQICVSGVVPHSAFMFRSALYPAVIQFRLYRPPADGEGDGDGGPGSSSSDAGSRSISASVISTAASFVLAPRAGQGGFGLDGSGGGSGSGSGTYKVIFKNGDDLRQDQLVIQMVSLMDHLLKRVNLDLKLTPYRILATGPRDGMIEFVGRSSPISEVLAKYGTIHDYFRAHHPDAAAPFGIQPDVISTFVKSCAGYCVITYLLGALHVGLNCMRMS